MRYDILSKLKIFSLVSVMRLVWAVDITGTYTDKTVAYAYRFILYSTVLLVLFTGFAVDTADPTNVFNFFSRFSRSTPNILGVATSADTGPSLKREIPFPEVSALSIYAVDIDYGKVLYEKNSDTKLPPASTTKLMTALTALDIYDLTDTLYISDYCTAVESQKVGYLAGELVTVNDLIHSLLISSSGDSACTLSSGWQSDEDFVDQMNEKATELGMYNTSFTNPIGLDSDNGDHVSTAFDLHLLALRATQSDYIRNIVGTKEVALTSLSGYSRDYKNTNDLLWNLPGTIGIKTGRTYAAGEVLIYQYSMEGKNIMIVVMGSLDRFTDTKLILEWILESYSWVDSEG